MADGTTTNYDFVKPEVGASDGTWGGKLNDDLDAIDTAIKTVDDNAETKLSKTAGGTMAADIDMGGHSILNAALVNELLAAPHSAVPSGSNVNIDLAVASVFDIGDVSAASLQITLQNRPVGGLHRIIILGNFTHIGSTDNPFQGGSTTPHGAAVKFAASSFAWAHFTSGPLAPGGFSGFPGAPTFVTLRCIQKVAIELYVTGS